MGTAVSYTALTWSVACHLKCDLSVAIPSNRYWKLIIYILKEEISPFIKTFCGPKKTYLNGTIKYMGSLFQHALFHLTLSITPV